MRLDEAVAFYERAWAAVLAAGYGADIEWQKGVRLADVTEQGFLRDVAFVILNSGMRASVCDGIWPKLRAAFEDFSSATAMLARTDTMRAAALQALRYPRKIDAMLAAPRRLLEVGGWPAARAIVERDGTPFLRTFPYIGPTIVYHLAKNIGLQVAKPDRHLVRIAEHFGEPDVQVFCRELAARTGDSVPVVDLVLWRYAASVRPGYLAEFG
jgi:3-methyladenine DNA glycosylase Tag